MNDIFGFFNLVSHFAYDCSRGVRCRLIRRKVQIHRNDLEGSTLFRKYRKKKSSKRRAALLKYWLLTITFNTDTKNIAFG